MLFNLLFFVSFATGYIHSGEIKIFKYVIVLCHLHFRNLVKVWLNFPFVGPHTPPMHRTNGDDI